MRNPKLTLAGKGLKCRRYTVTYMPFVFLGSDVHNISGSTSRSMTLGVLDSYSWLIW